MKVYQEADVLIGHAKIRQQLGFMNGKQHLDRFEFHYDLILDHEVEPIAAVELNFFVGNREGSLFFDPQTTLLELICQAQLISRLQETGAEIPMDFDGCADDAA